MGMKVSHIAWAVMAAMLAPSVASAQTIVSANGTPGPASAASDAGNAKSVLAARVAAKLLPPGIYRKLLDGPMQQMMGGMMGEMRKLPLRELAGMGNIPQAKLDAIGDAQLGEVLAIMDPHFDERMRLTTNAVFSNMGGMMEKLEPDMREGMAEAYANQFTLDQLAELDRFFATPTGMIYGEKSMLIMTDPAVMSRMQKAMPMIMQEMPAIMKAAMAAGGKLPPPRTAKDLTPAERKRLEAIFGK
jgi:hypothetical protein